jgi:hypothetical protein
MMGVIPTGDHGNIKKIGEVPNIQELIESLKPFLDKIEYRIKFRNYQFDNPRKSLHMGLRYAGIYEGLNLSWPGRDIGYIPVRGKVNKGDWLIASDIPGVAIPVQPNNIKMLDWYMGTAQESKDTEEIGQVSMRDTTVHLGLEEEDFVDWLPGTEVLQDVWSKICIQPFGRVRLMAMPPYHNFSYHIDVGGRWTMHIPLTTNSNAYIVSDGQLWHFPVGGIYVVNATVPHTAMNAGDTLRSHIITTYSTEFL